MWPSPLLQVSLVTDHTIHTAECGPVHCCKCPSQLRLSYVVTMGAGTGPAGPAAAGPMFAPSYVMVTPR